MGKIQMLKGEPIKLSTTHFCLLCPIIYFFQKLVELVNAWGWEEYGSQYSNLRSHQILENGF